MFALIAIVIFVLIIAIIIYFEYKNEKEYQEKRRKRADERRKTKPPYDPKKKIQKPLKEKNERAAKLKAQTPGAKQKTVPQKEKESIRTTGDAYELKDEKKSLEDAVSEPEISTTIDLPKCKYPKFDHTRLIKMGLNEDEVKEFVAELIPQIETQIPLIKEAMKVPDFHNMERLTHSIKGSSTTVGTGGISDLLVDFNTYLKAGTELSIAEVYFEHLQHYIQELKEQYS